MPPKGKQKGKGKKDSKFAGAFENDDNSKDIDLQ